MNTILGIDIGGSALKGAPVDLVSGQLLTEREKLETADKLSPEAMAEAVAQMVRRFDWRGPVGVGFPGVVHGARIAWTANLHKGFCDYDAATLFSRVSGCPVTLVNDADAAGLAELRFGAGKGVSDTVLVLTLGTGVGSALFHNGRLHPNTELGHIVKDGQSIECYVSAASRVRRGLDFEEWGRELNDYLIQLEKILYPDLFILGGGISREYDKFSHCLKPQARVVPAEFRNTAGIVGAALAAAARAGC